MDRPSPKPWTLESDTIAFQHRWITLRSQRLRTGAGTVVEPFFVVESVPWVCVVPLLPNGEVVLVEQYRNGARQVAPELPAGNIDPGEDPQTAALRELTEETGYRPIEAAIPLGTLWPEPSRSRVSATGFLVHVDPVPGPTAHEASEDLVVRTIPFARCFDADHGGMIHAAQIAFVHLARSHL